MATNPSGYIFLRAFVSLSALATLGSAGPRMPAPKPPTTHTVAYANQLLDGMFSSDWRRFGLEEAPSEEGTAKALVGLGEVGWDETFKRLEAGRYHDAFVIVLGRGSPWVDKEKCTVRLMGLLESKKFARRSQIPRIIASREPLKVNQLLLPFLADSDQEVREFCVIALKPLVAAPPEIEAVIRLLDDPDHAVRFQSRVFLQRATGHVTPGKPEPGEEKAEWLAWWQAQQPADMAVIVKSELARCTDLLTDPNEEFRERAGSPLMTHSGQPNYGTHQKDVWWSVHNGERSKAAWKEWLRLRYGVMESAKTTRWEDQFHLRQPQLPLAALRATIAMNVGDVASENSAVRSLARSSISHLLEDSCPFRMDNSDGEDDWLDKAIALWWANRMKVLGE